MISAFGKRVLCIRSSSALFMLMTLVGHAQTIPNPSFEQNTFTIFPGYAADNGGVISGWTISNPGRVGLNPAGGNPFSDTGTPPTGVNIAFIQATSNQTNSLSATINDLIPGLQYRVSFRANHRALYETGYPEWSLNGGAFVPFTAFPAVGGSNPYHTNSATFVATNTTAALVVRNGIGIGDSTVLVDHFTISQGSLVVTNDNDGGPGSLRQLIADSIPGDIITFASQLSGATIVLTNQILIASTLVIDASGLLSAPVLSGAGSNRIFYVTNGAFATLKSMTLSNGLAPAGYPEDEDGGGAAVFCRGRADLLNCNMVSNRVVGEESFGGAIACIPGGDVRLTGCTLTGNSVDDSGGAIYNYSGKVTVSQCTFSGNSSVYYGGAVYSSIYIGGVITKLVNSTFHGNTSGDLGGAIHNFNGPTEIVHCTITGNTSSNALGDGVFSYGDGGTPTTITESIIAGNAGEDVSSAGVFFNSITSLGHNLIGNGNAVAAFNQTGDLTNTIPLLAPLDNYGGPTQTMPPMWGSLAIDGGANSNALSFDQRGYARESGFAADIGAVEVRYAIVFSTNDSGSLSLREAVAGAPELIVFAPVLSGETITLASQILITNAVTIDASTLASGINISGNGVTRAFYVTNGAFATLKSLTIANGLAPVGELVDDGGGGAIFCRGRMDLLNCNIVNNRALHVNSVAGGIVCFLGDVRLTACTLTGNSTGSDGGAIYNYESELVVSGCTLSDNSAGNLGGAVYSNTDPSDSKTTLVNSTVSGNASGNHGGGLYNHDGRMEIIHCTISGNISTNALGGGVASYGDDFTPTTVTESIIAGNIGEDVRFSSGPVNSFFSSGHNLIGNGNAFAKFNESGDITNGIPLLAPLGNYGGPTQTMPPLAGSPAIDAGANSLGLEFDQRGVARSSGAGVEIGAVELQEVFVFNANDNGPGSLRNAVATGQDIIRFDYFLAGQTIVLTNGQITLSNLVTIDASTLDGSVAISGNHASRVFEVMDNSTVTLNSLSIINGFTSDNGGGVLTHPTSFLTLNDCTVAGNQALANGGGIYYRGQANQSLNNCTVVTNHAGLYGGGVHVLTSLKIHQCTFAANFAPGGGGMYVDGGSIAGLNQCTVVGNAAGDAGGGILVSGVLDYTNCIIAANLGPEDIYILPSGGGNREGVNIIQSIASLGIPYTGSGIVINTNPLLAPLGNFGGPTQTIPPRHGSRAIDATGESLMTGLDQRGYPRVSGNSADIGAVEAQFSPLNNPPVLMNVTRSTANKTFQFMFTDVPHADFSVLTSTNAALPLANWTFLGSTVEDLPGFYQFTDTTATNSARFYRVTSP
jgi:parallel beta-helix repeat protein/predicted outer membrane repeat protein